MKKRARPTAPRVAVFKSASGAALIEKLNAAATEAAYERAMSKMVPIDPADADPWLLEAVAEMKAAERDAIC